MGVQFRDVRLVLRIANIPFLVTFINSNLLSIRISCIHILSNEKIHLYVNEIWRGHVYNLKLTADRKYPPFKMMTLKWRTRWRTGNEEFVKIMKSPFISAIQSSWWKCLHISSKMYLTDICVKFHAKQTQSRLFYRSQNFFTCGPLSPKKLHDTSCFPLGSWKMALTMFVWLEILYTCQSHILKIKCGGIFINSTGLQR